MGGASYHHLGQLNGMTNNTKKDWWGLDLRRLPIDDFARNNQPKLGVRDGGEYGRERTEGGVYPSFWWR